MKRSAFTVWFTGISGSGKSTLAGLLRTALLDHGWPVELLDSGEIRRKFNTDLGFTHDEIARNLQRLAYECALLNRNGVVAIVAAVSPYRSLRQAVRAQVDSFIEIYCDATPDQLKSRDPDGLLDRAARGEIQNVAGVNAPYEPPEHPEIHLRTGETTPDDCLRTMLNTLAAMGHLPAWQRCGYTSDEAEMIKERLRNHGYT